MSRDKQKFDITATIYSLAALLFWIIGPVFIKELTAYVDFWTQNLLRYSTAAVILLPFLPGVVRRDLADRTIWKKALLPTIPNAAAQCLWAASLYYINPAFMVLLSKSFILWTTILSMLLFTEERPLLKSIRFWIALAAMIIGLVGVTIFKSDFTASATLFGTAITLLWAVMWSLYTIAARGVFKDADSRTGFAIVSLYTAGILAVLAFLFGRPGQCMTMPVKGWFFVTSSGVLSIAISHTFYYAAIKRIGVTIPSLVTLAQPFCILVVSWIVFAERLTAIQWFFGGILIAGAAIAVWAQEQLKK